MARKKSIEVKPELVPEIQDYSEVMQKSYVDYALSVIIERAVPDIRDGLKPVQRRILYDMLILGIYYDKPYRKSARIVGDTMGKFHVHGDSSIYGALVHMAQDWKFNKCLIDGHGNFGSIDGDGAAAMRYTEARLSQLGQLMLEDINEYTVPFKDNYDGTEREPVVLPCRYPQLFTNGTSGVAVGMGTDIPPHNLGELIDGILYYMKNKKCTTKELMKFIKGPDYPTGGIIINKNDLESMYETGNGKVIIRSKIDIEDIGYGKTNLIISELPYTLSGSKEKLIESIINLMKDKKLDELSDIRDESDEEMRIVLEVKKGVNLDKLLNKLYKRTKIQDTQGYNFLVIDGTEPKVINLKEYFDSFLSFQEEITTKKYQLLLEKKTSRLEIIEGLLMAMDVVDYIIEAIRGSKNIPMARKCLIDGDTTNIKFKTKKAEQVASKFKFTESQANYILELRFQTLTNLEINKISIEKNKLIKEISSYEKILKSKTFLHKEIIKYLEEIKNLYATSRKTKIIELDMKDIVVEEDEIIEEDIQILIDRFGYIKVVDIVSILRSSEDTLNNYKQVFTTKNTDKLAVFTNLGNLYQIKLQDMPRLKMKDKGQPLDVLCKFKENEEAILIKPMNDITQGKVLFLFSDGYAKYVSGKEYITRQKQIVGTKLYNNEILDILFIDLQEKLVITTNKKTHKIDLIKHNLHKKSVKGNKWIKLKENEEIQKITLLEV